MRLLAGPDSQGLQWKTALLDAITYCAGQILSTGFSPELRLRMDEKTREEKPFHALIHDVENLLCADSSVFVTSTGYGPTLTLAALAHRTASLLAGSPLATTSPM